MIPRVVRNHWSELPELELGGWEPSLTVSVIIPAYNCQESLDLTLASLSHQTYPAPLMEVVVVDDSSAPPLELPKLRPENCRIVRVGDHSSGWGRSNALDVGAECSSGEILHWLDADMIVFPEHIEAQARWHHVIPYAVTLGYKRFVATGWTTPEDVVEACSVDRIDQLFRFDETEPHDYVERLIDDTDQLRAGDHLNFRAHVGATAALRRDFYALSGGLNTSLRLGEDTEFGFRLAQAGAVFIPEPQARSWHMGPSSMMRNGDELRRYNQPFLADLMPHPRWLRRVPSRSWAVPLVTAVVSADGTFEQVRACVDSLLTSDEHDLHVLLTGEWESLPDSRGPILADPLLDLRLLAATYRSEPRVSLVSTAPESVFPSPYRLNVPSYISVHKNTVRRLVGEADKWQVGLVRVLPQQSEVPVGVIELWRTSAISRGALLRGPDESLVDVVTQVHGQRWVSSQDFPFDNLLSIPAADVSSSAPGPLPEAINSAPGNLGPVITSRRPQGTVEVGGIRSWARATAFVARLGLIELRRRAASQLRRLRR